MKGSRLVLPRGAGGKPLRYIGEDGRQTPSSPCQFLARRDHKSHQASPVVRPERAGCVREGNVEGKRFDNKPIGTYVESEKESRMNVQIVNDLHSVRFIDQRVDHQFLIIRFPSSHIWIRVYNILDIVLDVLPLFALIMQGNTTKSQGFKNNLDVDLGSAGNAYPEIRNF